jgi:hypothetical protein
MSFKLLRGEISDFITQMNNQLVLRTQEFRTDNIEFCFQFNNDEPINFASGENDLHIHIRPTPDGNIIFTNNNGDTFKIFARERE